MMDASIIKFFGRSLEERVQQRIIEDYLGEQPVGTSFIIETRHPKHPFLAHTPTILLQHQDSFKFGKDKIRGKYVMTKLSTKFELDTWVNATWDEYIQTVEDPIYEKAKCYYNRERFRIEMSPLGTTHSKDHSIVNYTIHLFATLKGIPLNGHDCCSYRRIGVREIQPDLSFYIGENADVIPWETTIIDLNAYPPPDLVIEIANSSLPDDIGEKRLLYEDTNVKEYWIVDVQKIQIIVFAIENGGSWRIANSQVLPGFTISILEEALRLTRQMNHSQVGGWLLTQFQQN